MKENETNPALFRKIKEMSKEISELKKNCTELKKENKQIKQMNINLIPLYILFLIVLGRSDIIIYTSYSIFFLS